LLESNTRFIHEKNGFAEKSKILAQKNTFVELSK